MTTDPSYDVLVAHFEDLDAQTGYLLWQLRESVFVVEQECAYAELDGRDLEPGTVHVWVARERVPVGYLRILDDGPHLRIGRVLVAPEDRGHGLGEVLMTRALGLVGDRRCRLDAQSHLASWYERFGFAVDGPEFTEDGILHTPMVRG